MTNSAFLGFNRFKEKINKTPLFIKNEGEWNIFKCSIFIRSYEVSLSDDFDIYGIYRDDIIYSHNEFKNNLQLTTQYLYHKNDDPSKLVPINYDNLYDYIILSRRESGFPSRNYLPPFYKDRTVYLIDGYKNHIFIPLRSKDAHDQAIYFKFFIDINPDLYWGKDLTSYGNIEDQLRYIFGKDFDKFIYYPLELVSSTDNSKLLDLPDYSMIYRNQSVVKTAKQALNIKEDPEFEYIQLPEEVKQTELNFDEFYSNNIGFKCEPTYSTLELRKFFLYGFVTGSLSIGIILSILALICKYL